MPFADCNQLTLASENSSSHQFDDVKIMYLHIICMVSIEIRVMCPSRRQSVGIQILSQLSENLFESATIVLKKRMFLVKL